MNVQASYVITMLHVLTMKVILFVNVMLGILEMDLVVPVSNTMMTSGSFVLAGWFNHDIPGLAGRYLILPAKPGRFLISP